MNNIIAAVPTKSADRPYGRNAYGAHLALRTHELLI